MKSAFIGRAAPLASIISAILLQSSALAAAEEQTDAATRDGAGSEPADGISEVTVSARRRNENAQDVPIPIAAIDGQSLTGAGRFRLEDLNQRLPSTNVQFNNPRQTSIAVRGLGNNPANDALESSVGVYLDNVYLGRATMAGQQVDDHQWTQELRLASPAERSLSYVIGLYFFDQGQDNLLYTQYGPDATAIAALQLGAPAFANGYTQTAQDLKTHSGSLFGQLTWRPADDWEFAFGLRGTKERKTVQLERTSNGSAAFVTSPNFAAYQSGDLKRSDTSYSGLLSASYQREINGETQDS